jgi:hypothetical protein
MGTRGRKSAADLSVISAGGVSTTSRPKPPSELTTEQADEWRAIVNHLSADRFPREMHGLLSGYCRHIVALRHVGQLIDAAEQADELDIGEYDRLLKMQERESRCIASLAVRLGIAQTTIKDTKRSVTKKPWE